MKLFYTLVLLLTCVSCKKTEQQLTKITAKNLAIDHTIIPSAAIDSMIKPYKEELTAEMQQLFCYAPKELTKKDGTMQSSLGNLMADICLEMAHPVFKEKTKESLDFAMFNYGGMRASLPVGAITKAHAFKLMPFENELVAVRLTGEKVAALMAYFIASKKAHPFSKNIALTIHEKEYDLQINGEAFDKNKTYNVLTSDYLQGGGDQMDFFKNPEKLTPLDYKLRAAIIDYLKKIDTLKASLDNRVILE